MKNFRSMLIVMALALFLSGCGDDKAAPAPDATPAETPKPPEPPATPRAIAQPTAVDLGDGIIYKTVYLGEGEPLVPEQTGTFKLDLTTQSGEAVWSGEFSVILGSGQGFPGLDRVANGMKLEEVREAEFPGQFGPENSQDKGPLKLKIERIKNLIPDETRESK